MSHLGCLGTVIKKRPEFSNVNNEIYFLPCFTIHRTQRPSVKQVFHTICYQGETQQYTTAVEALKRWRYTPVVFHMPRSIQGRHFKIWVPYHHAKLVNLLRKIDSIKKCKKYCFSIACKLLMFRIGQQ